MMPLRAETPARGQGGAQAPTQRPWPGSSKDMICCSSIDWDFIWQGHQEIMSTLAAAGHRILFIENTGVRAPRLRDLPRLIHRLRNWRRGTKGFREERPNLFVYSPIILPFPYARSARWVNRGLLLRALERWMRATSFRCQVVWTFLPTPLVRDLIRALDPALSIYYCIDDFASSSAAARTIRPSEDRLFAEADLVFVTSEQLRRRALRFRRVVHLFPFGVQFEKFAAAREAHDTMPDELRLLRRPIAGYVGGLHQWVDQDLLARAAERLPGVSFVLVGPIQSDVSRLSRLANVHLLGARPHDEVPRYVKGFDAGLVPYRLDPYTAHVYPTKLNEYLAMGIPVIGTDLPELRRFNAEFGDIVSIARDLEEFVSAVGALGTTPPPPEVVERRIEVSSRNSWQARIERMSELIEEALRERGSRGGRWQELLRELYQSARRRAAWVLGPVLALYLLMFHTLFPWVLAEPLHLAAPPRPADAIVVFAGGVGETGKAGGGGGYQERVKRAVDLYDAKLAPVLIFSSGYTFVFHETWVMRDLARSLGVPEEAILLETSAANTFENVAFVHGILAQRGWRRILLVSSPYHMRRATLVFRKIAPDIEVIPTPVPFSQFYTHGRGASLEQLRAILHEYLGMLAYWWKGWI